MSWMILIALINGLLIGLCRSINGSLSQSKGPFKASFHNHWVGAAVLTVIIFLFTSISISSLLSVDSWQHVPTLSLTGGILGALYVAINSHILSHIGALKAALFVISGQMITGVLLSVSEQNIVDFLLQLAGVLLIIIGMYFNLKVKKNLQINTFRIMNRDRLDSLCEKSKMLAGVISSMLKLLSNGNLYNTSERTSINFY